MFSFDWQGMTSYWCSICMTILGLGETVDELQAVKFNNNNNNKNIAGYL